MNNIFNNNNVYILGAGFSFDASMPLVNNFLFRMRETPEWIEQSKSPLAENRLAHIRDVFSFRLRASASAYRININIEDIEQLFSLASASESDILNTAIIESIASTLDYCRKNFSIGEHSLLLKDSHHGKLPFLRKDSERDYNNEASFYNVKLYDYYAAAMLGLFKNGEIQGDNTFISFNYDTFLEEALWNIGQKINYGLERAWYSDPSLIDTYYGVKVFKLHGSINWTEPGQKGQSVHVYPSYDQSLQSGKTKVLIPPTWRKTFSGSLEKIWNKAIISMSQATRIIIIGFSIPDTDMHFKYLLAAALENNISLREIIFVNPMSTEEYNSKIKKIFHQSYINSGSVKHLQMNTYEYLLSSFSLEQAGREKTLLQI